MTDHPTIRAAINRLPTSDDLLNHRHCCVSVNVTLCGHHIPDVTGCSHVECIVCADLNPNHDWCPLFKRCRG